MSGRFEAEAQAFLAKALENVQAADLLLTNGLLNACANRCYYACFQAGIAALCTAGIFRIGPRWEHDGVASAFDGQLIYRRKLYPSVLRGVLRRNRDLREGADYKPTGVSRTDAERALRRARLFVETIAIQVGSRP